MKRTTKLALAALATLAAEITVRPRLQWAIQGGEQTWGYYSAILFSALPNLVWYLIVGVAAGAILAPKALDFICAMAFLAILMKAVQYPSGLWIAPGLYSYVIALSPVLALPLGFSAGVCVAKIFRVGPNSDAPRPDARNQY